MKLSSITSAIAAFIRTVGTSSAPGAGEGILGAHLEDLNGTPLASLDGQQANSAQYGLPFMLQNDENMIIARGDRFGGMALATIQPLISWLVEGATLNSRIFFPFSTTMTAVQTAQGLTLNSGNVNTLSTNYQLNTFKQIPMHMKAPVLMRLRARFTQFGVANANADFGVTNVNTTLGQTANLNGFYWRIDSSGVMPVLAFNGSVIATGTDISSQLNSGNFYHWGIIKDDDALVFTVQNTSTGVVLTRQTLRIPSGQQKAFLGSHAQPYVRVFHGAVAPSAGMQCIASEFTAGLLDANFNMTASQLATNIGLGGEQGPLNYTTTSNILNSVAASTTTPTNTTATVATLDGSVRINAPAGATTDFALFSYTVPTPYQYRCKGVVVAAKNLGAVVAGTPTQIDYFLSVNGNGVTLAGNLTRKYIGTQTFPVGAAIGSSANEGRLVIDFKEADLITEAGRVITLVARIGTGTATAAQLIETMYTNLGHFE